MSTAASIALVVAASLVAIAGGRYADRHPTFGIWWYGSWAITCAVMAVISALQRDLGWAIWQAVCAVLNGLWWNQSRRNRKRRRALAAAGAKSRARLQAVVAKHRAAQRRTRPVLRPVPGAAA